LPNRRHFPFVDALVEADVLPEGTPVWIELPNRFTGLHQQRRDEAIEAASKYNSVQLTLFSMSLASLDDWSLPGLVGKVEDWDFTKLDLQIIYWVNQEVQSAFEVMQIIPKNYSPPSPNGATEEAAMMTTGGDSETGQ
jgi:hypothetical protein